MLKDDINKIVYNIVAKYERVWGGKNFPKNLSNKEIQKINIDGNKGMERGMK